MTTGSLLNCYRSSLWLAGGGWRWLLLFTQGCAAASHHEDGRINLLPCGQPVDASCDERQSSYTVLPSMTTLVHGEPDRESNGVGGVLRATEALRSDAAELPVLLPSSAHADSLLEWRPDGADPLAWIVKQGRHRYFFRAYRELFALARECPTKAALETFASLPTALFWDFGRERGQAKALRARGLVELGYYDAARLALQDPSIVETFPAFAEGCVQVITALPSEVLEETVGKEPPPWEGASFWGLR